MAACDQSTPEEVWYPIPGFPGYEFSSDWRVRSFYGRGSRKIHEDKWTIKSPRNMPSGYPCYQLSRDGKNHIVYLHHIVAMLAYGPTPDGLELLHWDDDKDNNFASNLQFGTKSDNANDAFRNGKRQRGSQRIQSKNSDEDIRAIRLLAADGVRQDEIAGRFGISQALVSGIVSRKRWGHVA
jgi:hypothetical protein